MVDLPILADQTVPRSWIADGLLSQSGLSHRFIFRLMSGWMSRLHIWLEGIFMIKFIALKIRIWKLEITFIRSN